MLEHITKEFVEDLIGCEVAAFKVEQIKTKDKVTISIVARPKTDPTQVKITIKPK